MIQIVTLFRQTSNEHFKYILNEKYTMAFLRYELLHNRLPAGLTTSNPRLSNVCAADY